jgi:hypothetical protein
MGDTNYIGGVFKILERPKQKVLKNNTLVIEVRAQISQQRQRKLVTLIFWGNLARELTTHYQVNDYLIIEGYLSLRAKKSLNSNRLKPKKVHVTVLKIYPFLLGYDRSISKT